MKTIKKAKFILGTVFKTILIAVLGMGIFALNIRTGSLGAQPKMQAQYPAPSVPNQPDAWMTTPWTASSAPYLAIRAAVFQEIKGGMPAKAVLAEARMNAQLHPKDLKAQYRWLCAANYAAHTGEDFDQQALAAVASLDPCNIQVVAHSRWLAIMQTQQNESHPALQPMGERLLKADPSDRWVRLHLIYDLAGGKPGPSNTKPLAKALAMAQAWTKAEPSNAAAHSTLAYVWQTYWNESHHKRIYAENAIAEFNAYLRLAPPNDSFRHDAEYLAKGLTKRLPSSIP